MDGRGDYAVFPIMDFAKLLMEPSLTVGLPPRRALCGAGQVGPRRCPGAVARLLRRASLPNTQSPNLIDGALPNGWATAPARVDW
jgi:hypothetical protein